ncbi:hypothetical protein KC19_2G068800 [Ceratodon purpureus]|uniref:Uncharacterized protein n=1 Tax=Ceratodon purpureus TaxID=3225 RepID=A0A8T0IUV7_CERPU|nr:hypothetical protein KC19_2G068800 [Ceratodon purpureus]
MTSRLCKSFEQRRAERIRSFKRLFEKVKSYLRTAPVGPAPKRARVDVDVCEEGNVDVEVGRLESAILKQERDEFLSALGAVSEIVDISNIGGVEYFELLYKLFSVLIHPGWSAPRESFERAKGLTLIPEGNKYDLSVCGESDGESEVQAREYHNVDLLNNMIYLQKYCGRNLISSFFNC